MRYLSALQAPFQGRSIGRGYAPVAVVLSVASLVLGCGGEGDKSATDGVPEATQHEAADQCDDGDDNDGDGFTDCDDLDCRAESDDCEFAPQPDRSIVSNLTETSKFLYTGPDPVQKDFDEDALDFWRTSLIHGRAVDVEGEPLRDVRVSVKDHPEYGFTETRFDGRFDLVVNGGGVLVLDFAHDGHIAVQRSVATEWQSEHVTPDVGMLEISQQVHRVRIGSGEVVRSDVIEDDFGKRQPFLVFPEWVEAEAVLPNGDTEPLDELSLRVTQYPFEPHTPSAPTDTPRFAPGSLPTRGGFSYSIDVNVEEAEKLDATSVRFSEPVAYYVENFLGLPVGAAIPLRSYDASSSEWESMGSGVVVEIVDIQAGLAQIDADGDGDTENADALEELGVFRQEREELARRFEPGDTLMRSRVTHFSTLTQVWEAIAGSITAPPDMPFTLKPQVDEPFVRDNVLVDELVARETVRLAGTPFSLVYQGNRSHGNRAAFQVSVPLVGDTVPAGLTDVFVVADIGGRLFPEDPAERRLAPKAGLTQEFLWDGKNSFGQLLQGEQVAKVWVGYGFSGASVAGLVGVTPEEVQDALPFSLPSTVLWSWQHVLLGMLDSQGFQFGGFGLSAQHAFDPKRNILYFGDGRQRTADPLNMQIVAVDQSVPASSSLSGTISRLEAPDSMAVADDGSVFVSDDGTDGRIWRISPAGDKQVVLGAGASGDAGNVMLLGPQGVAIDPTDSTLFVVDWEGLKVFFLRPNGEVGVLLGDDPEAIIQEPLSDPDGVAVGPNRELYIADANRVLKVNVSSGQLDPEPYLGGVEPGSEVEVLPVMNAQDVPLEQASGIAVDQVTGSVFVASRLTHQVWQVEPNQEAFLVAGTGTPGFSGDGALAVDAQLEGPRGLALGRDGSLFIADQENFRIRRVFPSGEIVTVAGGGDAFPDSITPGPNALVNRPDGLAFGPDGSLFAGGGAVDVEEPHLFRLSPALTGVIGASSVVVPSDDGLEAYRFDQNGRHLETVDVMTGVTRLEFKYDSNNLLTEVVDTFDRTTTIERDGSGKATTISGPFGQKSTLTHAGEALESVVAVHDEDTGASKESSFGYDSATGLLNVFVGGEGNTTTMTFDELGRIETVTNPLGHTERYTSLTTLTAQRVSVETDDVSSQDVYERQFPSAQLRDGFSLVDRDAQQLSGAEPLDRRFSGQLKGGASIEGVTSASDQWGEQVRFPSELTLSSGGGVSMSQSLSISTVGLNSTPTGAIADPLDFSEFRSSASINGAVYQRNFDRAQRTLTEVSPEGRTTVTLYNDKGLPERRQVPGLGDTVLSYDDRGRIETVTLEADGESRVTRYTYGDNGHLESVTDPAGNVTRYTQDDIGRTTSIEYDDGSTTRYGYDDNDNLTSVTPPGQPAHLFSYENGVRLSDYVPPAVGAGTGSLAAGQQRFTFDEFDRPVASIASDGSVLEHKYFQDFYRPSQVWATPDSNSAAQVFYVTYVDDDHDSIESIFGPRNGILFEYDAPLLTRVEFQTQAASGVINLDYDNFFRLSNLHLVGSSAVDYTYDADSLLSQVGPMEVVRDAESGLISGANLGSITTDTTHNGFGELRERSTSFAGQPLFSQSFERDALGRITRIDETNQGTTQVTLYSYDSLGRLNSATVDGVTTEYRYDDNGNRLPTDGSDAEYDDQDRILSFGDFEYEATSRGEVMRRSTPDQSEGYELVYDTFGSLQSATDFASASRVTYESDPLGRRVGRRVNGGAPKGWLYSDTLRVIAEIDNNAARTDFIYGTRPNVPDYMFKFGTTFYRLITDQLGSVRLVVDVETGEVVQELAYDPWGKVVLDTNPGFQPFGFAGGLYDPVTGLVRFGARDYDASVGRWTSKDPANFAGGINVYVYADNDPVNRIDPFGLDPVELTVVENSDWRMSVAWASRLFIPNRFSSISEMVDKVIAAAGSDKISRLNIIGHGGAYEVKGGVYAVADFGKDELTLATLPKFEATLKRLRGKFAPGGFVHLKHCEIGQDFELIKRLSNILGVPVVAGIGLEVNIGFNLGQYVRCSGNVCGVIKDRP